jgi:hypothetical protein
VWCEQTGSSGGNLDLACSGADSCKAGPCTADQWTTIGEWIPASFFAPPAVQGSRPPTRPRFELAWDFPIAGRRHRVAVVCGRSHRLLNARPRVRARSQDRRRQSGPSTPIAGGIGIQGTVTLVPDATTSDR